MKTKVKRNRSKKMFIPEGATIYPDGSWFYKFTEEERAEMQSKLSKDCMFGPAIGYGELVPSVD